MFALVDYLAAPERYPPVAGRSPLPCRRGNWLPERELMLESGGTSAHPQSPQRPPPREEHLHDACHPVDQQL